MPVLRRNPEKVYLYKLLSEFYLIAPILIPYYVANGLSTTQVFSVQATYALSILLLEIPSGYLADVIGRRRTLVFGASFLPLGLSVYAISRHFGGFVLAEFLIAVGNSMRSGTDSALIYDTLLQLQREADYKKFEGRSQFFARIGSSTASVAGGLAAMHSLRLPFYINIGFSLLLLPVGLSLIEPQRHQRRAKNPLLDILRISTFAFRQPRLRLLMIYGAMIGGSGIVGLWAYFLYYQSLGIPIAFFGLLFALTQLTSALGSPAAHRLAAVLGNQRALRLPLLIGFGFFLLGTFRSPLLIPVIMANMFLWNCAVPLLYDEINRLIESEVRATLLSVAGMSVSLAYIVLAPIFGRIVDAFSLATAFKALGLCFLFLAWPLPAAYFRQLAAPGQPIPEKSTPGAETPTDRQ